jgi:hypothetical protein
MKCDLWDVLCDGGEIKVIDDLTLLDSLASIYYRIKFVIHIEKQAYQTMRGINVIYPDGKNAAQLLLEEARIFDEALLNDISSVCTSLDSNLLRP